MNYKLVIKFTSKTLLVEALCMVLPLLVCLIYQESPLPFLLAMVILLVICFPLTRLRTHEDFFAREGYFTVGLIWILMGVFGALPFFFSGTMGGFVDCFFETISGFTTTGSTILTEIQSLPRGILFWRSFTHWMGGMGVLVLAIAIIPSLGPRTHFLMQAESPGPVSSKLVPKISQSSKILYLIYCGISAAEVIALRIAGLSWYDALVHTFGTVGTGGFSNYNASIAAFQNPAVEIIITIFMLLCSINFSLYFLIFVGRVKDVWKSDEFRFFLFMVVGSIGLVSLNIYHMYRNIGETVRLAAFQVASIVSTTGFATADFDLWPEFSRMLLVLLMFIGACAGSTGGGMKCSRVLLLCKAIHRELRSIVHPRSVHVVKLDGKVVEESLLRSVLIFTGAYFIITFLSALAVSLDNFSFTTSLTAAIACISNIGPGLELVGATGNFSMFSPLSKLVLSGCMVIGRLEIFPILVLFSRNAWSKT